MLSANSSVNWDLVVLLIGPIFGLLVLLLLWEMNRREEKRRRNGQNRNEKIDVYY